MAPRLRKKQIKVTEEAEGNSDAQAETVSSSEETLITENDKPKEEAEAELKQEDEQDLQMDIEIKGNAPTVTMSWEKDDAEEVPVEKVLSSDQVAEEETTENVNRKRKADSENDETPSKTAKVFSDGFRIFVGNLNDTKTREELKNSLESYLKNQNFVLQEIVVNWTKKYAFVEFASEMDLTNALALNGEVLLDKPMNIARATMRGPTKVKVKAPAVDKEAKDARCLFLKNVPAKATKKSIRKLFPNAIDVSFPGGAESPSQGIAILEFKNNAVAKKVLKEKEEVKLQGRVLIVDTTADSKTPEEPEVKTKETTEVPPSNTLFVSNLSEKVEEKHLKKVFPGVVDIRVRHSRFKPGSFAFIEFATVADAEKALKSSQSLTICQKAAKVQFSQTLKPEETKVLSKTLIVKNLAVKTTAETLQSAFEGAVSARVTMDKETGLSKRFGFVEFESDENCNAAKKSMEDCEIDGSKVFVAYAKAPPEKVTARQTESPKARKKDSGKKCSEGGAVKRKADPASMTPPAKKTKLIKAENGKQKAGSADEKSKKSNVIDNDLSLYVGNLDNSKEFEEIKTSLATYLMNQSLLFQDIRLDTSKKHAFVDFTSEMDLNKALLLNGETVLDKPMKIAKAKSKSKKTAKVKTPPVAEKGSKVEKKKSVGKGTKGGKIQAQKLAKKQLKK